MKTTTKKLSDTKVEIKIVLDAKDLTAARDKAATELAKEVKISGFRKGKAPVDLALKNIDPNQLSSAALDMAIRTAVPQAFIDAKQNALVAPEINVTKFVPFESAEFTATADVLPEIKLGNYKNLKVKATKTTVAEKDIQEVLDNIARAYAEKAPVKRAAKLTDETIIDFTGKKDGVAFDGGHAKDFHLVLGSGQFIPGFEEGIVGHEAGDRFELELKFPADYHNKDLAGQKTVFEVLLKQVSEQKLPAFDDEFAKKCGPFKSMDELKSDIKQNLTMQNQAKADEKFKDDLVQALVAGSKVSAPEILISDQLHFIKDDIARNAAAQGITFEQYLEHVGQTEADWEKEARKIASDRVKASLVLQVLANEAKITVDDDIVETKIAELREVYKKSPEAIKNLKDPRVRQDIKNRLTIEKTLNFLVETNR